MDSDSKSKYRRLVKHDQWQVMKKGAELFYFSGNMRKITETERDTHMGGGGGG